MKEKDEKLTQVQDEVTDLHNAMSVKDAELANQAQSLLLLQNTVKEKTRLVITYST